MTKTHHDTVTMYLITGGKGDWTHKNLDKDNTDIILMTDDFVNTISSS
jgi:hypothetical protein